MTKQSNPVLFVMMGAAAALSGPLTRLLEGYQIKAAGCVNVPEPIKTTHIQGDIHYIQQGFLQHRYTTGGLIRVGYVLHGDAPKLLPLRTHIEKCLLPLYPSGIITDIYWLTDETSALENDRAARAASMQVLQNGLPEAQIYMLSNLNSNSHHASWEEVLLTVALLTLFKDGEPREYVVSPDASRYNEFMFMQNAAVGTEKPFLTAGSGRLQVPEKALRALLITALLNQLPLPKTTAPPLPIPLVQPWTPHEDFIYGFALSPEAGRYVLNGLTRKEVLTKFFGTRLDTVLDMNPPHCEESPDLMVLLKNTLLFDALATIKHDGPWAVALEAAMEENQKKIAAAELDFGIWASTPVDIQALKTDKKRLLPFYSVPNFPYTLGAEYLARLAALRAYKLLQERLETLLVDVFNLSEAYEERRLAVEKLRKPFEEEANALTEEDTPFAATKEYFMDLFTQHAHANAERLQLLTANLGTENPLPALDRYINTRLLTDPVFVRPFTELLSSVADGRSLTDWAAENRHTQIRLRAGSSSLYSEANLHMPTDWAANVKTTYEGRGHGRVNLFTDSEANRVSVLYHAGAFGADDLYYADLYR